MAHRLAGRAIVGEGEPLHVPTEGDADATHYLELSPGGYNDLRPRKPEVKRHSSGMPPPGSGDSISGRAGVSGQRHVVVTEKPSKLERVKAALPGTKEHKAKKEAEADAEVGQLGA